jgi:hypothetical protein
LLPALGGVLAYGPGPPVDLIPYFLGLMAWAGLAFVAVFLSPFTALLRRLRRIRGASPQENKSAPTASPESELSAQSNQDRVQG